MNFEDLRHAWAERDERYAGRIFGRLSDHDIAAIRAFRLSEVEHATVSPVERTILWNEVKGWTPWYQGR